MWGIATCKIIRQLEKFSKRKKKRKNHNIEFGFRSINWGKSTRSRARTRNSRLLPWKSLMEPMQIYGSKHNFSSESIVTVAVEHRPQATESKEKYHNKSFRVEIYSSICSFFALSTVTSKFFEFFCLNWSHKPFTLHWGFSDLLSKFYLSHLLHEAVTQAHHTWQTEGRRLQTGLVYVCEPHTHTIRELITY